MIKMHIADVPTVDWAEVSTILTIDREGRATQVPKQELIAGIAREMAALMLKDVCKSTQDGPPPMPEVPES